jgi:hypothetical protein
VTDLPVAPAPPSRALTREAPEADLNAELAAIEEARRALRTGDGDGALKKLDDYLVRFPRARLREEEESVRVDALAASGNRARARSVGAAFLRTWPASPYAPRVKRLMDASD